LQVRRNDILDGKEPPPDPSEEPEFKENAPKEEPAAPVMEKKSAIDDESNTVSAILEFETLSTHVQPSL
jgi:hypothetical protein